MVVSFFVADAIQLLQTFKQQSLFRKT